MEIEIRQVEIDPDEINLWWKCPHCWETKMESISDLIKRGVPDCYVCDEKMIPLEEACKEKPEDIWFDWICPECLAKTEWSYLDLATAGNPVCSCDNEMILGEIQRKGD
jgi:hypothetical protein